MEQLLNTTPNTNKQLRIAADNIDSALWQQILETTVTTIPTHHQQKQLTNLIRQQHTNTLTNHNNERSQRVHLSTTGTGAGAWLHAPTGNITPLSNDEFATAAKTRLDKKHTFDDNICCRANDTSTCSYKDNGHFDHTLTCKFGPYRNQRHNAIRDELANIITDTTGHTPLKEQIIHITNDNNQTTNDDSTLNRSDITFQTPTTTYHIDVMVTSATTVTAQAGATTAGYPSVLGEQAKRRKYGNHPVTPAVMEVHGHLGETLLQFLTQLSLTLPTQREQTNNLHYNIQRLATTLQRHNAKTIHAQLAKHMLPPQTAATN